MARPGLLRNRKFIRLARALGDRALALGSLELIWGSGYESGDDALGTPDDVEAAADWKGAPGTLFAALRDAGLPDQAGFVEKVPEREDVWRIHDLYDHAPEYVQRRMEREAARTAKGKTISDLRSAAAKSRWAKEKHANGCNRESLADRPDANGVTPSTHEKKKTEDTEDLDLLSTGGSVPRAEPAAPSPDSNGKRHRREPHPDFSTFRARWCASYKSRYQTDYVWKGAQDNALARQLLDTLGMAELSARCKAAFALPDDNWIAKDGLTIGRVAKFINELGKAVHSPKAEERDDTAAGVRFLDSLSAGPALGTGRQS